MILLYAASREPRRGETPVTRASAVPAAALAWGSSVEYRQQRKSKKAAPQGAVPPRYGAAFSALRQKYGDRPPPLFSRHPFSSLFQSSERPAFTPLLIPRTILIFVPQGKILKRGADMDQNVNYYGIILLLRQLRESGSFSEKELRRVAARIAADSGADIMISL